MLTAKDKDIILSDTVVNENTNAPIAGVVSYEFPSGKIGGIVCDQEGYYYEIILPDPGKYMMSISSGFLNKETSVIVEITVNDDHFIKGRELMPIEVGMKVGIDHIYFDFNKGNLRDEFFPEFNMVPLFLKKIQQ